MPSEYVPDDLVSTSRAAQLLKVNPCTVARWVIAGRLKGWRVAGRYRVSEGDVRAMMRPVQSDIPAREMTKGEREAASEAAKGRLRKRGVKC